MYAVVRTGGKQLRVRPGDSVRVEKLDGAVGKQVELSDVLLIGGEGDRRIGTPRVDGARVIGTITAHGRGEKITVFKFKRRKNYRRKQGHRQDYTELKIEKIESGGKRGAARPAGGDD
ncbi:MAG: 50S ribosomal protein L21 [Deltaproteobacteria bacterium]|nr:MAG: 50S ribosomal protein L21 [Deltaproteobacteria bacterium]